MDRQKVKSGLGLMFWGNIVALFAVIPILGGIAVLIGGIMELIAIVKLKAQSEKYNNAFWFSIIGIVLSLFTGVDGFYRSVNGDFCWLSKYWRNLFFLYSNRGMCKYSIL